MGTYIEEVPGDELFAAHGELIMAQNVIQQVGPHRVKLGSITDGLDDLMQGHVADVFYSDPPWGEGLIKGFETLKAKYGEGRVQNVGLPAFLDTLFHLAGRHTKDFVFIEYGKRWENMVINAGVSAGLAYIGTANCLYKSGSKVLPHHVHLFSKFSRAIPPGYRLDLFGNIPDAADLVEAMLRPLFKPGQSVLDPCCGLGATAVAAKRLGLVFYGNELTQKRLDQTVRRLR
jgi:hypothetical protein